MFHSNLCLGEYYGAMFLSQGSGAIVLKFSVGCSTEGLWASFAFLGGDLPVGAGWGPWDPIFMLGVVSQS